MLVIRASVLLVLLGFGSAFLLHKSSKWDGLRVTWGVKFFNDYFDTMPRNVKDAVKQGFKKISDCDENANWRGARYVKKNDTALILLFDKNGYIAGIQTLVPPGKNYPHSPITPPFVKDGDNNVISAYFVDPSTICSKGRSEQNIKDQGTGTQLYIQNGTNAETDSITIPMKQKDIKGTMWTEGKCFYTMGKHYWYNLREDMDCNEFFPVFLLYNGGRLNGLGWAMDVKLDSPRYEHPQPFTFKLFMNTVPKCLTKSHGVTTMHIYLTDSPSRNLC